MLATWDGGRILAKFEFKHEPTGTWPKNLASQRLPKRSSSTVHAQLAGPSFRFSAFSFTVPLNQSILLACLVISWPVRQPLLTMPPPHMSGSSSAKFAKTIPNSDHLCNLFCQNDWSSAAKVQYAEPKWRTQRVWEPWKGKKSCGADEIMKAKREG